MLDGGELSPVAEGYKPEWEQKLSEVAARIEQELRAAVRTVDEDVVPEIRAHSSSALRKLASKLEAMATHLDEARKGRETGK